MRKGKDMWQQSNEVRCAHLLFEDLKKERNDIPKIAFYIFLQDNYNHLRGKSKHGNFGYKIKWIDLENQKRN
ncbi:MAG: hypothetical protein ACE1ZQ_09640 [Ignavibacteriaceae bacterium]